ncbi:hypothetical protein M422DRAFT_47134 [Sphaerobolus stellatus SS14]|uniref:F-box domain-containing protein n=1 Tax=Sphaerobolus stellatus (strain SS14) TaxID=990650 RepID=A0A0C9W233_SPHS4|nr:hypothetical protein M422DRAFT_47134 [Sphaerobolus stellatus SS14]
MTGFEDQPLEILDKVINNVEDPKDILSLSLTSKDTVTSPSPTIFTTAHIRCDPRNNELWKSLAERPRLAQFAHKLEFVPLFYIQRLNHKPSGPPLPPRIVELSFQVPRISADELVQMQNILPAILLSMIHLNRLSGCVYIINLDPHFQLRIW